MNYTDLSPDQQKQVLDQSGYTDEQLKSEDPYFIEEYNFAEEMVSQFAEMYDIPSEAQIYIDEEHLAREWGMDYTDVTIDGTDYKFRSW